MERRVGYVSSAPGKIILFGEHAVVYDQLAIAASIDLRTYSYIQPVPVPFIQLEFNDVAVHLNLSISELPIQKLERLFEGDLKTIKVENINKISYNPNSLEPFLLSLLEKYQLTNHNGKGAVVATLATFLLLKVLLKEQINPKVGFQLKVISNIPVGAGLGSSASFSVAMTSSLLKLFLPSFDNLTKTVQLQLINRLSYLAEKVLHGNPSGVDNTVATFGNLVAYQTGKFHRLANLKQLSVMVTDTQTPKNTKLLVANVRILRDRFPEVINPIIQSIGSISSQFQTGVQLNQQNPMDPLSLMNELIPLNQNLLRTLNVSHPTIEKVVEITSKYKLHTKLTGAGGGGCCITLIPNERLATMDKAIHELKQHGFVPHLTKLTDQGIRFHELSDTELPEDLFVNVTANKL